MEFLEDFNTFGISCKEELKCIKQRITLAVFDREINGPLSKSYAQILRYNVRIRHTLSLSVDGQVFW